MLSEASTLAPHIDTLFFLLCGISAAVMALVGGLILTFTIRYRRGTNAPRGPVPEPLSREVEIGWTVATLFLFLFVFWFATSSQIPQFEIPKRAMEIHVQAKQWMWKAQHPDGTREIDRLTVPANVAVRLVMTSEDVIHSFYVPDFRVKQDVLPGRYTQLWFEAKEPGRYHLFCAEFCGTQHSRMGGWVDVLPQPAFARWLRERPPHQSLVNQGRAIWAASGCASCHAAGARVPTPSLGGLFGARVALAGGGEATADEDYLRTSIVQPQAQIVSGYANVMPSYEGRLSEEQIVALIAYIRSLPGREGYAK
jgi:cytochrome c oxidase subunit 2